MTETYYLAVDNDGRANPSIHGVNPPTARCAYCGDMAVNSNNEGNRGYEWFHFCDCEGATKERELSRAVWSAKTALDSAEKALEAQRKKGLESETTVQLKAIDDMVMAARRMDLNVSPMDIRRMLKALSMEDKLKK